MTKAFLIVSVACNVWFLFLLLYDRIMDTKLIRFFRAYCRAVAVIGQYGGRARKG